MTSADIKQAYACTWDNIRQQYKLQRYSSCSACLFVPWGWSRASSWCQIRYDRRRSLGEGAKHGAVHAKWHGYNDHDIATIYKHIWGATPQPMPSPCSCHVHASCQLGAKHGAVKPLQTSSMGTELVIHPVGLSCIILYWVWHIYGRTSTTGLPAQLTSLVILMNFSSLAGGFCAKPRTGTVGGPL